MVEDSKRVTLPLVAFSKPRISGKENGILLSILGGLWLGGSYPGVHSRPAMSLSLMRHVLNVYSLVGMLMCYTFLVWGILHQTVFALRVFPFLLLMWVIEREWIILDTVRQSLWNGMYLILHWIPDICRCFITKTYGSVCVCITFSLRIHVLTDI